MRVVVLTDGSRYGAEILLALAARNVGVHAILVHRRHETALAKLRTSIHKYGLVQTAYDTFDYLRAKLRKTSAPPAYENFCDAVHSVEDCNGPECLALLKQLDADLLVLAGTPLLKAPVIASVKTAVLNAHPGLLPKYRGVDVVAWSILNGDPIGVTVHHVDAGIDTGRIIAQEQIAIETGDTIATLRRRAEVLSARLMAEVVSTAVTSGVLESYAQARKYPLCARMPRRLVRKVEAKLRNGTLLH